MKLEFFKDSRKGGTLRASCEGSTIEGYYYEDDFEEKNNMADVLISISEDLVEDRGQWLKLLLAYIDEDDMQELFRLIKEES